MKRHVRLVCLKPPGRPPGERDLVNPGKSDPSVILTGRHRTILFFSESSHYFLPDSVQSQHPLKRRACFSFKSG